MMIAKGMIFKCWAAVLPLSGVLVSLSADAQDSLSLIHI